MASGPPLRPFNEDRDSRELAEGGIIKAILIWPEAQPLIFAQLHPDLFHSEHLALIFECALRVYQRGTMPDVITIDDELVHYLGARPPWYTTRLREHNDLADAMTEGSVSGNSSALVPGWIALIHRHHRFSAFKQGAASARTIEHVIQVASAALEHEGILSSTDEIPIPEALAAFLTVQENIIAGTATAGHSWGIETLDEVCLLTPGCLYIVAGIKKGGKSQLLQHTLLENAKAKNPVFLFSLEMGIRQVLRRWLAHETRLNSRLLLSRALNPTDMATLRQVAGWLQALPLRVNQSPRITPAEILARTRAWRRKEGVGEGCGVVAVDFLQLMPLPEKKGQSEASGLKDVAYELARLAKEEGVAVIAAVQLRNEAEGEKPQLRYIEGSGGLAQAAEAILLLDLHQRREDGLTTAGYTPMDVIVYQRNGESGRRVELVVDLATSHFTPKY